jgi:hypothetical protein
MANDINISGDHQGLQGDEIMVKEVKEKEGEEEKEEEKWKALLLQYWAEQRHRDVWVHPWAVPSLLAIPHSGPPPTIMNHSTSSPTATSTASPSVAVAPSCNPTNITLPSGEEALPSIKRQSSIEEKYSSLSPAPAWRLFKLPHDLLQSLQTAYYSSLGNTTDSHSKKRDPTKVRDEPLISAVFNQLETRTGYAPIPPELLGEIVDVVVRETADWLQVDRVELQVTGAYGLREYRRGAVINWHVDPAEMQPITAIVHVADLGCENDTTKVSTLSTMHSAGDGDGDCGSNKYTGFDTYDGDTSTTTRHCDRSKESKIVTKSLACNWPLHLARLENGIIPLTPEATNMNTDIDDSIGTESHCKTITAAEASPVTSDAGSTTATVAHTNQTTSQLSGASLNSTSTQTCTRSAHHESDPRLAAIERRAGAQLDHIYLAPGEGILIESARMPHARLLPLRGERYANAFVHLAPVGWEQRVRDALDGVD